MTAGQSRSESLVRCGETMTGAEIVVRALIDQGVDTVFGYPGGAILPVYDALFSRNDIRHILVRHEQAALHAAEGYARSSGRIGVAVVTSGPGATNAVTGLTDALMDSTPIICFSGQVPTHLIGTDAFQEADIVGITRSCTKHNVLVLSVDDLARTVHEAFAIARGGRPGPVLVDLPKDVQQAEGLYVRPQDLVVRAASRPAVVHDRDIERLADMLLTARAPILYTGGGVMNSGPAAVEQLHRLLELVGAPATSTLMGLGGLPASAPNFLGMLGMHGTYEANMAMHDCDFLLAIGARFDDRITGRLDAFSPYSSKAQIDIDSSSINKTVLVDLGIVADCGVALTSLNRALERRGLPRSGKPFAAWWDKINAWKARDCLAYRQEPGAAIKPQYAVECLWRRTAARHPVVTTEVGQHQMWAAQYFRFERARRWVTSGGLGTMGYGFPSAIGAQIACPDDLVLAIAGEASFLMNLQELSTVVQYRQPVKIFILNNQWMGMVRQWQELLYENRTSESYVDSLPDFVRLAEAFGVPGLRCSRPEELDDVITKMLETPGPVLVDCLVEKEENCFPMIPPGAAHNEMVFSERDPGATMTPQGRSLI